MFTRTYQKILIGVLVIGAVFGIGVGVGKSSIPAIEYVTDVTHKENVVTAGVDFAPFWEVWKTLDERFVPSDSEEGATDQERVWGAIEGLVDSLGDPYTTFLPPKDALLFEEDISGNFSGVGMEIGIRDDVLTVIAPLRESPAERAGIQAGDSILQINGESTADISVDEAVRRIRGEAGTVVTLTLFREGQSDVFDISVARQTIHVPTLQTEERTDGIFVIELLNFNATAPEEFRDALQEFVATGDTKLILDLRGNPGGFLEAAIDIASWFLPSGKIVVSEAFDGQDVEPRVHRSRGYNIFGDELEMVILVNGGSASASEILAGALQQHHIAQLVGTQTFGKGSVQELIKITPETSLKVTVAQWVTPDGTSISHGGLTPDIVVERTRNDIEAGRDPQLDRAVELFTEL